MNFHSTLQSESKAPIVIFLFHIITLIISIIKIQHLQQPNLQSLSFQQNLYSLLFLLTLSLYFLTAYSDPGILRNQKELPVIGPLKIKTSRKLKKQPDQIMIQLPYFNNTNEKVRSQQQLFTENQNQNDYIKIPVRVCSDCQLNQPLRTKHCLECEECIAMYDHHCFWIGQCVGQFNKVTFLWYLLAESLLLWWGFVWTIESFQDVEGVQWLLQNGLRVFASIVIVFFGIMVSLLLGYHSYLVGVNLTTWEHLGWKRISYLEIWPKKMGSPFSRGIVQNLVYFCCYSSREVTIWNLPKEIPLNR